ncbi:MAG TPA: ATP-binding protein [Gemmatimonadales bacterium]|nr:ATP-binding protein [Gemmatimonadales bacterium]
MGGAEVIRFAPFAPLGPRRDILVSIRMLATRRLSASLQRWLTLRTLLLLLFFFAAVYAAAAPFYVLFRSGAAASALAHGTERIVPAIEDLTRRVNATYQARQIAERARSERFVVPRLTDSLELLAAEVGAPPIPGFEGDPEFSGTLAHVDSQFLEIAATLRDIRTGLTRGQRDRVAAGLSVADSLTRDAAQQSLLVVSRGREVLQTLQAAREGAVREMRRDLMLWLAVGVLLTCLGLFALRRRFSKPLGALELGLARVAEGDLNTQLPVARMDEAGRLASHFNQMTAVLRNRAEEQGRFAAAGELLAGIAHEVNNPLMAIAAHAENRLSEPGLTNEQREEMQQVLRQAQRATKLLRGLLRFVHSTEPRISSVNLNDVVRGALDLVSYRFGVDEVTVGGKLDPELPVVAGDVIRLEQVLVNLMSNAIDSLRLVKPPRRLTVDSWVEDGAVCVAVADNGPGIAPDVQGRLFRPFATTKGRRGTGLGLYISRQIAREAGGDLALVPAPGSGGGARFVMRLPAGAPVAKPAQAAPRSSASSPAPTTSNARSERLQGIRILIVDDEEPVRRPMARFLKRRGAEVREASDGAEALAQLEGSDADVIIADLRMPRMSGTELFAALEAKRPALAQRILFLSGDVSQLAIPGSTPVPRERVLVKPVELGQLEARVVAFVVEATERSASQSGVGRGNAGG